MSKSLPARPSLEQLKKQAKELLEAIHHNNPDAVALFAEHHPTKQKEARFFALHDAQLVMAREYGFSTWPKIKEEIERLTSTLEQRVDRFIIDARDNPDRARRALEVEPTLANASWWTQLVTGNVAAVQGALKRDATLVSKPGGPCYDGKTWLPLHYVCFSRLQMEDAKAQSRFTECARLLLDAGADANAAMGERKFGAPHRPLYGAAGKNNNPPLARLLLERGANVNDGESIYQAAVHYHLESLEILHEFGVSFGTLPSPKREATPLHLLLGFTPNTPQWPSTRQGIRWLLDHGCDPNIPTNIFRQFNGEEETALHFAIQGNHSEEIIRWLLEAGADANRANKEGTTPILLAHRAGRKDLVAALKEHGAMETILKPKDKFLEAAFSGDRNGMLAVLEENPTLIANLNEKECLALHLASAYGNIKAIHLLVEAGFDIAFKGISKTTPLHMAAWSGKENVIIALLSHAAPVNAVSEYDDNRETPLRTLARGSSVRWRNPQGAYPQAAHALLAAGAIPKAEYAEISSPEVAEILHAALAGQS